MYLNVPRKLGRILVPMIEGKLSQANGRLRASKVGVLIEIKSDRFCLRATLPSKPDSKQTKPHQQRIYLGLHTNPTGLTIAEKEARRVGALLDCGDFNWQPYLTKSESVSVSTVGDCISRLEIDYFQRRDRTLKTETTWKGDYLKVLKQLPQTDMLTVDLMKDLVLRTSPDSKSRKRACMVMNALSKFAQLSFDFSPYAGKYSPKRVTPRDLPNDKLIAEWFFKIKNPSWQWIYGIIATYGLRPHEAFHLDYEAIKQGDRVISVLDGKTGSRRVWACYPEWYEQFLIQDVRLPNIDLSRSNTAIGGSCSNYFYGLLPFHLYDLRHCWAIRTLEFGLDISLAAQQMGHSAAVHSQQYHHWITEDVHQRAYEALMLRNDRPKPPSIM